MLMAAVAASRRRMSAYPTVLVSSAGTDIEVSLSSEVGDILTVITLDRQVPGTFAYSGFDGLGLAETTATQTKLVVARTLTSDDAGIKSSTITYTPNDPAGTVLTVTIALLNVGAVALPSSTKPYKGAFMGFLVGAVNPYNRPLNSTSRKTYSCVAPATELLCGVYFQIASNQSASESKSAGTGNVSLAMEFRGHRAASSPSLPGAVVAPERTFTHDIGTTVGGSGGDVRRMHRRDFYTQPRGTTTGGSTTTAVLALGSSSVNGHYVGAIFRPKSGPLKGVEITITGYTGSTRTITFATQASAITSGVGYAIGVKVTAGTTYHACIRNMEASPSTKHVSLNAGSSFTGGTGSGQTAKDFIPSRTAGPFYGANDCYVLEQSGGTYPNETYTRREGMLGWFGWDYDVIDVGQVKLSPQHFDFGGDGNNGGSIYKRGVVGGSAGARVRTRWKQVGGSFTARYVWLKAYYVIGARPNQGLTVDIQNESDNVSVGSWVVGRAVDGLTNDTDTSTINSWSPSNTNADIFADYTRLDLGADKTFTNGKIYRIELSCSSTNAPYYIWLGRNNNDGMQVYDDNDVTMGLNNRNGLWQSWREDPDVAGRMAFAEQKTGSNAWDGFKMYGSSIDRAVQMVVGFEAP